MNNLSWLIYFADVLNSLGVFLAVVGCITTLGSLGFYVFAWSEIGENCRYGPEDRDLLDAINLKKISFRSFTVFLTIWTISMFLPSKDTMYMIAASEMGEEALQTPEFEKVRKIVNQYLDDQLTTNEEQE